MHRCNGLALSRALCVLAIVAIVHSQHSYDFVRSFDHAGVHEFVFAVHDEQSGNPDAPQHHALYLKLVTYDSNTRMRGFLQFPADQNASLVAAGGVGLQAHLADGRTLLFDTSEPVVGDLQPVSGAMNSSDIPSLKRLELTVGKAGAASVSIDHPLETTLPASLQEGPEEYVVVTWADQRTATALLNTQVQWHTALGFDRVVAYAGIDVLPLHSTEVLGLVRAQRPMHRAHPSLLPVPQEYLNNGVLSIVWLMALDPTVHARALAMLAYWETNTRVVVLAPDQLFGTPQPTTVQALFQPRACLGQAGDAAILSTLQAVCWSCEHHEPLRAAIPASDEFGTSILQQYTAVLPGTFTSAIVNPNMVDSYVSAPQPKLHLTAAATYHHVAPLSCAFVVEQTNLWKVEQMHNATQRPLFESRSWQWPVDASVAAPVEQQQEEQHDAGVLDFATAVRQQKDLQDSFEVLLPVITQLVTRLSTMQQPLPQATHAVLASVRDLLLAGTRAVDVVMLGTPGKDMQLADQIAAWNDLIHAARTTDTPLGMDGEASEGFYELYMNYIDRLYDEYDADYDDLHAELQEARQRAALQQQQDDSMTKTILTMVSQPIHWLRTVHATLFPPTQPAADVEPHATTMMPVADANAIASRAAPVLDGRRYILSDEPGVPDMLAGVVRARRMALEASAAFWNAVRRPHNGGEEENRAQLQDGGSVSQEMLME